MITFIFYGGRCMALDIRMTCFSPSMGDWWNFFVVSAKLYCQVIILIVRISELHTTKEAVMLHVNLKWINVPHKSA